MQRAIRFNCYGTPNKVAVIKLMRSVTSLGLKEAKDLVEETMGHSDNKESTALCSWDSEREYNQWHAAIIDNGVTIIGELDPVSRLDTETTERLVGNAQQLIIDCIMDRAWNMARDLIDVLERHDTRLGDRNE